MCTSLQRLLILKSVGSSLLSLASHTTLIVQASKLIHGIVIV